MTMLRFSHHYCKMPRDYTLSEVLDVLPVRIEDLSPRFIEHDTAYLDGGELRHFPLPATGDYALLLLRSNNLGHMWTTLRDRHVLDADRLTYYRHMVGQVVKCVVGP